MQHSLYHQTPTKRDWRTRLLDVTLYSHWRQADSERLRRPLLRFFGYIFLFATIDALITHMYHLTFWVAMAATLLVWLFLMTRKGPFSLLWIVLLPVVALPLIAGAIIGSGQLTPYGLIFFAHTIFSAIFFRARFKRAMYLLAFATMATSGWLIAAPGLLEKLAGVMVVSVLAGSFLDPVMHDVREQAKQNRHLSLISSTVAALTGSLDKTALERLCRQALDAFEADECLLLELSSDGMQLEPRSVAFTPAFERFALVDQEPRLVANGGSIGWVASSGKALISGDVANDCHFFYPPELPVRPISAMVVPVPREDGGVAGVFRIQREGLNRFQTEDFELAQIWAIEVGKILEKIRLHDQLRQMATTDPLTATYNRHYLNERWPAIVAKSQETGELVTFLMLDCFNFKQINDRYGHMMGDEVLRELGLILNELVPAGGFAVRYGGDEFLVVLPGSLREAGLRLRTEIDTELGRLRTRHPDWPSVVVDIGVYSAQGDALTTVLSQVDSALYDAKEEGYRARLAALLESTVGERARHMVQAVMTLTRIQELNDPYTRGHTERSKDLAMALGREMGLPEDQVEVIGFGAVLHDVGKIVVPLHILNKPGPLTDEEWGIMRMHPQFGANVVGELDLLKDVRPIILHHHERFDGVTTGRHPGYPDGLKGEAIPVGARIVSVVDTFDAMTSDRVYRKGTSTDAAMAEIRRLSGIQFDPQVVGALERLMGQEEVAD